MLPAQIPLHIIALFSKEALAAVSTFLPPFVDSQLHLRLIRIAYELHSSYVDLHLTLSSSRGQKRPINTLGTAGISNKFPGDTDAADPGSTKHNFSSEA